MSTIPIEVLMKIEEQRPDLAWMVHDLMATDMEGEERQIERRLADAYLSGYSTLTAEETLMLSACRAGRRYGDLDKSQLH